MLRRIVLLLALSAIAAPRVPAQPAGLVGWAALSVAAIVRLSRGACCTDAHIGSTVRASGLSNSGGSVTGALVAIDADSFTVEAGSASWRGARANARTVQVKSRETRWAQGWLTGLIIGTGIGTFFGLIASNGDGWFSGDEMIAGGAIGGAVVGSTAGAFFGLLGEGDRWQTVRNFSPTAIVKPMFAQKGAGIGLQLTFR